MRNLLQKLSMAILGIAAIVSVASTAPATAAPINSDVAGNSNSQVIAPVSEHEDADTEIKGSFEGTFTYDNEQTGKPINRYAFYTYLVSNVYPRMPDQYSYLRLNPPLRAKQTEQKN